MCCEFHQSFLCRTPNNAAILKKPIDVLARMALIASTGIGSPAKTTISPTIPPPFGGCPDVAIQHFLPPPPSSPCCGTLPCTYLSQYLVAICARQL